jgi:hypothetical protein
VVVNLSVALTKVPSVSEREILYLLDFFKTHLFENEMPAFMHLKNGSNIQDFLAFVVLSTHVLPVSFYF